MQHRTKFKVSKPGNYTVSFTTQEEDEKDGKMYEYHVKVFVTTKRGKNCDVILDLDTDKVRVTNKLFKIITNKVYKSLVKTETDEIKL